MQGRISSRKREDRDREPAQPLTRGLLALGAAGARRRLRRQRRPGLRRGRGPHRGSPRLYVSHGTGDRILPIGSCSRRLVPLLRAAGYDLRYRELDGPHTVPAEAAREALAWLARDLQPSAPAR